MAALAAFVLLGAVSVVARGAAGVEPAARARGPDRDQPRRQGHAGVAPVAGRDLLRAVPRDVGRHDHRPRHPRRLHRDDLHRHDRQRTAPPTSTRSARAGRRGQSGAGPARDGDAARRARARPATRIVRRELLPRHDGVEGASAPRSWYPSGIEGFLSASSVDAGGSVDLRVTTGGWDVPYHVEIYRTGHYGGTRAAWSSTIPGLVGEHGYCDVWLATTGLADCIGMNRTATITTTQRLGLRRLPAQARPRRQRRVQRGDPARRARRRQHSDVLYGVPTNDLPGVQRVRRQVALQLQQQPAEHGRRPRRARSRSRSTAPTSSPPATRTRTTGTRAPTSRPCRWLEHQGYDTTYIASEDLHTDGAQLTHHKVFISGAHDEYWSQAMFDAVKAARDAGTSVIFSGANAVYWRVRFLPSPVSGIANRVMVDYKTIESGPADPSGHSTSTFRDPAGPNQPENAADRPDVHRRQRHADDFPLRVSAARGQATASGATRSVSNLAAGATASIGTDDRRLGVGRRASTTASSPPACRRSRPRPCRATCSRTTGTRTRSATRRRTRRSTGPPAARSVFATGTNNWWRGLAPNMHGEGDADARIQQATVNVLADMGARPTTLAAGLAGRRARRRPPSATTHARRRRDRRRARERRARHVRPRARPRQRRLRRPHADRAGRRRSCRPR